MIKTFMGKVRHPASSIPTYLSVVLGLAICSGGAQAFEIDIDSPGWDVRLDTSMRYTLGIRAEDCDPDICGDGSGRGDVTAYQSDRMFADAGDIVTNRLDVLSEFVAIYKRRHGVRVSAAGWYDHAYDKSLRGDPALDASGVGQGAGSRGDDLADFTKRWNHGPSGEFLDAFIFTGFDIGEVPVDLRIGQHNIYWGESMFTSVAGVAYNQGPLDFRKAQANPGIKAQELFLPLDQLSFTSILSDEISLSGQYFNEWKPTRLPDGGTYFGAADGFGIGGSGTVFGVPTVRTRDATNERGDWGLALHWRPSWLQGTMGFYYREFTNKFSQLTLAEVDGAGNPTLYGVEYDFGEREKLWGLSIGTQVAGASVGFDMTYRPDAMLLAVPFGTYAPMDARAEDWVPRGDIVTGVLNGLYFMGRNKFFDSAILSAEVNYTRLEDVNENAQNFNGVGYGCANARGYGCPTDDAWGAALSFTPVWYQVFNGVDITMPVFITQGIEGNSPVMFGDNEGQGSWSVGLSADIHAKHTVTLKYNGFIAKHDNDHLGAASDNNSALGKYWDRDWISLVLTTSF